VYLSWSRISGSNSYYIYRKAGNAKSWTKVATVTGTSYLDSNVKPGVTYAYTIRAYGSKVLSGYKSSGWKIMRLNTPELVSATSYKDGVEIKWQKVSYATKYEIYRKEKGDKSWKIVGQTTGNTKVTFKDKTAEQGKTYTYTVRARNGNYRSWYKSGISCKAKY
jgi:fibronectin type 3 domain-containing protein